MNRKRRQTRPASACPAEPSKKKNPGKSPDGAGGISDHAKKPSRRRLAIVLGIFAVWVALLLYCLLAGRVST